MRFKKWIIPFLLILWILPCHSWANDFKHGYERKTDEIYATVRHDTPLYSNEFDEVASGNLARFTGISVIFAGDSWYEIEYETEKYGTEMGWITKEDFKANCLVYDGRDKQLLADGDYQLKAKNVSSNYQYKTIDYQLSGKASTLNLTICYVGNDLYKISEKDGDRFLKRDSLSSKGAQDFWGQEEEAGNFYIRQKGSCFVIQDASSKRYLNRSPMGVIYYGQDSNPTWTFTRFNLANTDNSMRDFVQYDAEWCDYYYGPGKNDDPNSNVLCTSGCGILATVNAIYAATGIFADPYELADYAVESGYRILGAGTDHGIFKAAAKRFGQRYGFSYDGSSGDTADLIKKLEEGDIAIVHIPSHYITVIDYDKKKNKFLILDPHYLSRRGTSCYGDWIPKKAFDGEIQDGNLEASEYFFYSPNRPESERNQ